MTKWCKIALLILLIVMLTACSQSNNTEGTDNSAVINTNQAQKVKILFLSLSNTDVRDNIREKYIKANLQEELPEVEVQYDLGGGGQDYASKLKIYNSSGSMPDVWFSEQNLSNVVITAGNALDLAPYIKMTGFDKKYVEKEVIAPDKDGRIYCVQSGNDRYASPRLWYHKDIFNKYNITPPKTFTQLLDACEVLKDNGLIPISIVGKDGWTINLHLLQTMIMSEDPQVVQELLDNRTDFNNPVIKGSLERIKSLIQLGAFAPDVLNLDYEPAIKLYTSGKAAMLAMFSWELSNLEKAAPDTDFIPWPVAREGLDPNGAIQYWGAPLSGYFVSAKTKNPEVSARFAMYCAMQDALYYNIESKSPTALETGVKIEGRTNLAIKEFEQLNSAKIKLPSLWSAVFNTRMSAEITIQNKKLLTGEYSSEEYIKAINPVWKENIKELINQQGK